VFGAKVRWAASLTSERGFDLVFAFGCAINKPLVFGAKVRWSGELGSASKDVPRVVGSERQIPVGRTGFTVDPQVEICGSGEHST
jgi:hypothetical protein